MGGGICCCCSCAKLSTDLSRGGRTGGGGECVAGSCLGDLGLLWRLVLLFGGCTMVVDEGFFLLDFMP